MRSRKWVLAALLAVAPAIAENVQVEGHAVELGGEPGARQVLEMRGARYSFPGSPDQIIGKAQFCLSQADSGAGVVSVDAEGGRLLAVSRVSYRYRLRGRNARSRLAVQAETGNMSIVFTDFAEIQGEGESESYVPMLAEDGTGWESALSALLKVERGLVDCMFR